MWYRVLLFFLLSVHGALAEDRSAPPAQYRPGKSDIPAKFTLSSDQASREIRLNAPSAAEHAALVQKSKAATANGKGQPLPVGYSRTPAAADQTIPLETLKWQKVAGGQAAQFAVTSPTAAGIRLALQWKSPPDSPQALQLRFSGSAGRQVFSPVAGDKLASGGDLFWSPVLEGERGLVEIFVPDGAIVQGAVLSLPQISHLEVAGAALQRLKRAQDIGSSDRCEVDVACVMNPSQALQNAATSAAQLLFTDAGSTYLCSGNLLNTTTSSFVPYLYSANHCFLSQQRASTLNTYWFFAAKACGDLSVPDYVITTGGAILLYNDEATDVALLRLNNPPPAGVYFGGWNADPLASGAPAIVLHYPEGDLEKFSQGTTQGYDTFNGSGSFIVMQYSTGTTEPGSSGSGLLTFNPGGFYELRGGLFGGDASCQSPNGSDYYSRLDLAYAYISPFLAPLAPPASGLLTVVEFYNTSLNHYFITADPAEASGIDQGAAGPGWMRTGLTFNAYPLGDAPSVCRFYGTPGQGPNSHFYTADARECNSVKQDAGWTFEGVVFGIAVPTGGVCPAGTVPVYRAYNNRFAFNDSNHRFTTSLAAYQATTAQGWVGEGVVMCSPQ
jgi:hypothetical protein